METLTEPLITLVVLLPYVILGLGGLALAKLFLDLTTSYSLTEELTRSDNPAVGLVTAGYMGGVALAMGGALLVLGPDPGENLLGIALSLALGIPLLRASYLINDALVLPRFAVKKELIEDRNLGTGWVVAGSLIGSGLVLSGAMAGTSPGWGIAVRDIVVYWAFGQLVMVISGLVYQWITPYDLHDEVENRDNAAVGIGFAAWLVAVGLIVRASLVGAGSALLPELALSSVLSLSGILILALGRVFIDKVVLPGVSLGAEVGEQKNLAASAVLAVGFLALALLIGSAYTSQSLAADPLDPAAVELPAEGVIE